MTAIMCCRFKCKVCREMTGLRAAGMASSVLFTGYCVGDVHSCLSEIRRYRNVLHSLRFTEKYFFVSE